MNPTLNCLLLNLFYSQGQNYLVAIKTSAGGSAGKPHVPTPAGASTKPTVAGKPTTPTVATPTTGATTPSAQSSIEAKVSESSFYFRFNACKSCQKSSCMLNHENGNAIMQIAMRYLYFIKFLREYKGVMFCL